MRSLAPALFSAERLGRFFVVAVSLAGYDSPMFLPTTAKMVCLIGFLLFCSVLAPGLTALDDQVPTQPSNDGLTWISMVGSALLVLSLVVLWLGKRWEKAAEAQREAKISDLEKKVEAAPDKVKPAWELAQFTLERYFQRNLKQVNAIYWLSIAVMIAGFLVLLWGIRIAVADPNRVKIALIASASGILTEFISLTFMVIYRSTMSQANEYVSVLERINTVGMAMQILDSIADGSSALKDTTRAQIITLLLSSSRAEMPKPAKALRRSKAGKSLA